MRRRGGLGRFLLKSLVILLLAFGAGVGLLVAFPPTDLVRDRLIAEVERQTGRKLTIGAAGLSVASGLGVTLSDVTLSAPPSMGGAPLIKAEGLDVQIALLPFVLREVQVRHLVLRRPVVELRVDEKGRRSWDFADAGAGGALTRYAQASTGRANDAESLPPELKDFARHASPPRSASKAGSGLGLEGLTLADVRISDGRLHYIDQRTGVAHDFGGVNMRLSLPHIGGRLAAKGDFLLAGQRIALDGHVDTMQALLAEQPLRVDVRLDGATIKTHYSGSLVVGAEPGADGTVGVQAQSVTDLLRLAGLPISGLEAVGGLSVDGKLRASASEVSLSSARLGLGTTRADGSLSAKLGDKRPVVTADLTIAGLDLDKLSEAGVGLAAGSNDGGAAGRFAAPAASVPSGASGGAPTSIDDLLKRSVMPPKGNGGAQVRGFRQRAGNQWDVEAIDVTALRLLDLDGRFLITDARWRGVAAQNVKLAVDLKAGLLRTTASDGEIAGGKARLLANVDGRGKDLAVGVNLSADGVTLAPLLKAFGIDLVEGRGRAVATLSARGHSERDLVSTLAGRAEIKASEGALVGWNAEALLANLRRGEMPSTERIADARTPFNLFSASFEIANGVARTRDLKLDSPSLHASGAGLINIVDTNLDLNLKPKVVGGGIEIPVRVAGPWDAPKVIPDLQGALNSPQAQEAVRQLRDGNVDGALRSVLGDGPKAEKKIEKAKDFLKQFLSR